MSSTGPCNLGRASGVGCGDALPCARGRRVLHAGIEDADRLDPRIGAELDRQKSSARLAHDSDLVQGDLALQRRARSCIFLCGPVDRGTHVIGGFLPSRRTAPEGPCPTPKSRAKRWSSESPRSAYCQSRNRRCPTPSRAASPSSGTPPVPRDDTRTSPGEPKAPSEVTLYGPGTASGAPSRGNEREIISRRDAGRLRQGYASTYQQRRGCGNDGPRHESSPLRAFSKTSLKLHEQVRASALERVAVCQGRLSSMTPAVHSVWPVGNEDQNPCRCVWLTRYPEASTRKLPFQQTRLRLAGQP